MNAKSIKIPKKNHIDIKVAKFHLTTNMRAHMQGDISAGEFAKTLLEIGNGRVAQDTATGQIVLPCGTFVQSIDELSDRVYPDLLHNFQDHSWLCERAILAPKNDIVESINIQMQKKIPGIEHSYKCIDSVRNDEDAVNYPTEFLNSIQTPNLQPANLILKVGSPIMLIRNIDAPRLCNGTRLVVKQLLSHVIQATVMTGCAKGEAVFIPRIPINHDDSICFKRIQFPVKLCFAMTINKSQGQSISITGVDLRSPCFAHGQLYVACSRVGKASNLFILTSDGITKNVVYQRAISPV